MAIQMLLTQSTLQIILLFLDLKYEYRPTYYTGKIVLILTFHPEKSDFLRKGISGDWKKYFSVSQSERFQSLYDKELDGYEDLREFLSSR